MTKMNFVKKMAAVAAFGAVAGFAQSAAAAANYVFSNQTIGVDESVSAAGVPTYNLPGYHIAPYVGNIDKMAGGYQEYLSFGANNTFSTVAVYDVTGMSLGGTPKGHISADTYQEYAVFVSSGTYATSGGKVTFSATSGSFALYADNLADSYTSGNNSIVAGQNNPASITSYINTDTLVSGGLGALSSSAQGAHSDILLGYSTTLLTGGGNGNASADNGKGSFNLIFGNFQRVASTGYFTGTIPSDVQVTGSFDDMAISGAGQATQGEAGVYFGKATLIPEPGTMALAGLGSLLAALAVRRRKH